MTNTFPPHTNPPSLEFAQQEQEKTKKNKQDFLLNHHDREKLHSSC